MEFIVLENKAALVESVANIIERTIRDKPNAVLGLPTGSTPLPIYKELIKRYKEGKINFSQVVTFNLDEYLGLSKDHPQSYYSYMHQNLFNHINIQAKHIHIPESQPENTTAFCERYEEYILSFGGIDLLLLGIGPNGHIGFNEPADELQPTTHVVKLSDATKIANSRFFGAKENVPNLAITMGMKSILTAKRIILLAQGSEKAEVIRRLLHTGITNRFPASFLWLHSNVTVIADEEAASAMQVRQKEFSR